ncbi:MAG TPA: 50S ribosomal protein L32 [Dehalococcoidia bacterium]|nr:50S ribosomal protein L32 [Dehalococcoidia bacterium]
MPPLPKKKTSMSRKRRRRSHLSASIPVLVPCPQCRSPRPPHHACPTCGTYRGRDVLAVRKERPRPAPGP